MLFSAGFKRDRRKGGVGTRLDESPIIMATPALPIPEMALSFCWQAAGTFTGRRRLPPVCRVR